MQERKYFTIEGLHQLWLHLFLFWKQQCHELVSAENDEISAYILKGLLWKQIFNDQVTKSYRNDMNQQVHFIPPPPSPSHSTQLYKWKQDNQC